MSLNEFEKAQKAYDSNQFKECDLEKILDNFQKIIKENKDEIEEIKKIEKTNFDFDIEKILENNEKVKVDIEQIKRPDNFIVSKYWDSIGVIGVVFNGNVYVLLELLKKMLLTKNSMIFCTNDKMYALTNLIVLYFKQALKICDYDEEIVQVINSKNYEEIFNHNNTLKKIIVIGNNDLQNKILSKSKIEVIRSGYGNFDLYIEDIMDFDFLKKILMINNVEKNIYINRKISKEDIEKLEIEDYTEIEDVEECIRDININSARYSSSIFTKDGNNANKFLKLVKSKNGKEYLKAIFQKAQWLQQQ